MKRYMVDRDSEVMAIIYEDGEATYHSDSGFIVGKSPETPPDWSGDKQELRIRILDGLGWKEVTPVAL